MSQLTRRNALAVSLASGAALITGIAAAQEARTTTGKPDKDSPVTSSLRNVVIEDLDEANATLTARGGKKEKPFKLVRLTVSKEVRVVASHAFPSVSNHLPFDWEQLKRVKGKTVSLKLRVEGDELAVHSVSPAND